MKITAPDKGYTGTTSYGPVELEFKDGVAEHDGDLSPSLRQYLQGAGYGIGKDKPTQPEPEEIPDPRDATLVQVGTPLRDAAVDPKPEDFLPPVNAGKEGPEGNPHGPNVVAPGIHAVGHGPIVPGPVGRFEEDEDGHQVVIADTEEQQRRETTAAEEVFVAGRDVSEVTAELGKEVGQPTPDTVAAVEKPAGNASRDDWAAYVTALGEDPGDLGRDDLRDRFGGRS